MLPCLGHELEGAEHVAMVGDGHRRLPVRRRFLEQGADVAGAVEK
jgi:hypothetical protein